MTYTARYNRCHWAAVEALENHYQRTEVDARRSADSRQYTVRTKNVARLRLSESAPGGEFQLDGQKFRAVPENPVFEKKNGKWTLLNSRSAVGGLHKVHGLQGPIDDAFTDSFLCVRPTGTPFHAETKSYADRMLARLTADFAKWMRGDPRVKDDTAVTETDIANNNLILFGDPASNSLIARVLAKLPVRHPLGVLGELVDASCEPPRAPERNRDDEDQRNGAVHDEVESGAPCVREQASRATRNNDGPRHPAILGEDRRGRGDCRLPFEVIETGCGAATARERGYQLVRWIPRRT